MEQHLTVLLFDRAVLSALLGNGRTAEQSCYENRTSTIYWPVLYELGMYIV